MQTMRFTLYITISESLKKIIKQFTSKVRYDKLPRYMYYVLCTVLFGNAELYDEFCYLSGDITMLVCFDLYMFVGYC